MLEEKKFLKKCFVMQPNLYIMHLCEFHIQAHCSSSETYDFTVFRITSVACIVLLNTIQVENNYKNAFYKKYFFPRDYFYLINLYIYLHFKISVLNL